MKKTSGWSRRVLAFVLAFLMTITTTGDTFAVLGETISTPTDLVDDTPAGEEPEASEAPAEEEIPVIDPQKNLL